MLKRDLRVLTRHARDGLPPQLRSLKHVCFIHGRDLASSSLSRLKRDMRDALDLCDRVAHRVVAFSARFISEAARLAEVETAEQLAHDQYISARDYVSAQRRAIGD